jgi:hypothetical protein
MPTMNTTVTTEKKLTFTLAEIEYLVIHSTGLAGATLEWDECSQGGVRGCTVTCKYTRPEPA